MYDYKIIKTEPDLNNLVTKLYNIPKLVFDLETNSLETHALDTKIVGIGFCYEPSVAYYIPFNVSLSLDQILSSLFPILTNDSIGKIGHNIKFDARVLNRFGINVTNIIFDTMVASYCINGSRTSHNLDDLSLRYCNHVKIRTKTLIPRKTKTNPNPSMLDMEPDKVGIYCCEDVDYTYRLYQIFKEELELPSNAHAKKIFYEIDMPLVHTLTKMECDGVKISEQVLNDIKNEVSNRLQELQTTIDTIAGRPIVLTKPADISTLLYNDLKLHDINNINIELTATGQLSTAADEIEKLEGKHPVVDAILEYKLLTKIMSTYITTIPEYISKHTGLLHPFFGQTMTSTARLNSSNPNCQNIPARTKIGKRIREAFVSRFENGKIAAADYSQAELRILAHLGKEQVFLNAYNNNIDVHKAVASEVVYSVPMEQVTDQQRTNCKTVNFGLLYGMRAKKLAKTLGIDILEATSIMTTYMNKMSGLKKFLDDAKIGLKEKGYTENYFGRRRYIPQIYSNSQLEVWGAEREGANNKIQSTNADIIRIAMNKISRLLEIENRKSKMILQVHDELVFDLHPDEIEVLVPKIVNIMENIVQFDLKMEVSCKLGQSWAHAK